MTLAPYPKYKSSGVEWLGDVPAHWEVKRLKTAVFYCVSNVDKIRKDDEIPIRLCNYTDVYYHDLISSDMDLMDGTATPEEIQRFGLKVGDVAITKDSEDWNDIAVPAMVAKSSDDLVCGYHLAVIRPRKSVLSGRFLLRAFQSCAVNQQFQIAAQGVTRYGLPKSSIGEASLPLPSSDEQNTIAGFLDRETAKLDMLVAKKRTLIERLKEKRTALISRTVTRGLPPDAARAAGLDPHPKLKPSSSEWLGDVPEHWQVKPLSMLTAVIQTGPFGSQLHQSDYVDGGIPLVNPSHLVGGAVTATTDETVTDETANRLARYLLRRGDVIFARRGEIGRCAVVADREAGWLCGTGSMVVRFVDADERYFSRIFHSAGFSSLLELKAVGTTMLNLNPSILGRMCVPEPPRSEQTAVADFLDRETAKIDDLVAKIETAIERLQEYRTALITAAVTGKIDVRNLAGRAAIPNTV